MYPVVFRLGPIAVHSWGLFFAIAFGAGTVLAMREAKRHGIEPSSVLDLALFAAVGALVGARLMYVALDIGYYWENPAAIVGIGEGGLAGLSLHGGVLGGLGAGIFFSMRRKLRFFVLADLVAPSVALGTAIARIGCLLNGCCYGLPTDLPWGIHTRFEAGLRHPTQVYEAVLDLALFAFLWRRRHKAPYPGHLFAQYVVGYSAVRFVVEPWRVAERVLPWLTVAQMGSFIGVGFAVVFALLARRAALAERTRASTENSVIPPD